MNIRAQSDLHFDKRFVECEDHWVVFNMNKDSTYLYGFIYIDSYAGLTLNYEGTFKINPEGIYVPTKLKGTNIKGRLENNNVHVSFVPENRYRELQIQAIPYWLKSYKIDTGSISRLFKWGFLYNGWGECHKALPFLERAMKIDRRYKGLAVEIAYSYNCLGMFDSAIAVLQEARVSSPNDAHVYKELIYAQTESGLLDKATENCKSAILLSDTTCNGEICFNILNVLYKKGDKPGFNFWLQKAKKWNANNFEILTKIESMANNMESGDVPEHK